MGNEMPDKIRCRKDKAHLGNLEDLSLREKELKRIHGLIKDTRAVKFGLINDEMLNWAWDSYRNNRGYPQCPLVRFLCAEAWPRHFEEQSKKI